MSMTNTILHVVEPRLLLLIWQAPDSTRNRTRWAVGCIMRKGGDYVLTYFHADDEFQRYNDGSLADVRELGFAGYPAFRYSQAVHSSGVLDAFLRRLPPRNRSDFDQYRAQFRLSKSVKVSDFALLGITEAKLPSDGFSLVDPLEDVNSERDMFVEIAGYRHYASHLSEALNVGDPIHFRAEPSNPKDRNAVMVLHDGETVGYINRHQARAFIGWLNQDRVSAEIERMNGEPTRPRAFMFVRVSKASDSIAA